MERSLKNVPAAFAKALPQRSSQLWESVRQRYMESHRHYHGVDHLLALAEWFEEVERGPGWRQPREVACAMLFHDAVYLPGRVDNERQSAALARLLIPEHSKFPIDMDRVDDLIVWTSQHGGDVTRWANDTDAGHFLDADMAILGADPAAFQRYDAGVRAEYLSVVPGPVFEEKRRMFLEALLRSEIFITPMFRDRLDQRARSNIKAAMDRSMNAPSTPRG